MRGRLAAGALLVGLLGSAGGTAPAQADPQGGFNEPANTDCSAGQRLTAVPRLAGSFSPQIGETMDDVVVQVTPDRAPGSQSSATFSERDQGSVPFSLTPTIGVNGPVSAVATATATVLVLAGKSTATDSRSFCLAIPPQAPTGLTTKVEAQSVKVSWKANPEPDVIGYSVRRGEAGSTQFTPLGVTPDLGFVDGALPVNGSWQYQVKALRLGVSSDQKDLVESPTWASAPVATVTFVTTTTVAPPSSVPAGTGTDGTGAGGSGGDGSAGSVGSNIATSGSAGGISSGAFKSLLDANRRPAAGRSTAPDTGFKELLPFASQPQVPTDEGSDQELGADEGESAQQAVGQTPISSQDDGDRRRSISFLAGGLLSFVMLMQILWIKGEIKRAPIDLETETVDAAGVAGAGAGATPRPEPLAPGPPLVAAAAPARRRGRPVKAHSKRRGRGRRRPPAPPRTEPEDLAALFAPIVADSPAPAATAESPAPPAAVGEPSPAKPAKPAKAPIPMPAVPDRVFAMGPAADDTVSSTARRRAPATPGSKEGPNRAGRATRRVPSRSGGH